MMAALVCAIVPAAAQWRRAESQNFVVFAESSEGELRERVRILEDYDQLLRRLMRTETPPSPNKLHVYLVRGVTEMSTVLPGVSAAGVYFTNPNGILAMADMRAQVGSEMAVLLHEYAHHFMMQYHGRVYPPWYVEGFAEFMMTARFTDHAVEVGHTNAVRARTLSIRESWLPLEQILFERSRHPAAQGRFYAQSWLLTHYLLNGPERLRQLQSYMAALARAEDPRRAFTASFGVEPADLQSRLRRYAAGGLTFMRMPRPSAVSPPAVAIEQLPASAGDLLLLQASLVVEPEHNPEALRRIRRAAARHSDSFAQRVLAQAEAVYGDPAVAERLSDKLLAANPMDAELMHFRGMGYLRASRTAPPAERPALQRLARSWFSRAHAIDRTRFQTLYRYVQTFDGEAGAATENNAEMLLLANSLAPQVPDVRLTAARMLMGLGDFELAETLLLPLVSTAHEGPQANTARELIAKARNRLPPG